MGRYKTGDAKQGGFTIVEILLVAVLIALLAGFGTFIGVGTYKKMLAEKAARDFILAAKWARVTAIERQSQCRIILDEENRRFALAVYGAGPETGETGLVPLADLMFKKPVELRGDVRFEEIQLSPTDSGWAADANESKSIAFFPNGTAQGAIVQIGDGKNHYTANICAATGRVKMVVGTAEKVETRSVDLDIEF